MTERLAVIVVPVVILALLAATPAVAREDVLGVVPEGALGFVVINRLTETDAQVLDLGRQMQLPLPSALALLKASTGVQKGLDEKGSAALALMPPEGSGVAPVQVLLVPVTDFRQFVGQLKADDADADIVKVEVMNSPFIAASHLGYAVFTEPGHRKLLEKILDSPNSVPGDVEPMRQWIGENAAAVVVTRRGIKLLAALGKKGLQEAKASMAQMPEEMKENMEAAVAAFDVYANIIDALEKEIQAYAAGIRVDEEGALWLTEWARCTSDGKLAKMLAEVGPPPDDLLAGLPKVPFVAAGGGLLPEELGKELTRFSVDIMKATPNMYGLNEEQADKVAELSLETMKGVKGMAMSLGVGKPGDALYANLAVAMFTEDAKEYLVKYRQMIGKMNEIVAESEHSILKGMKLEEVQIGDEPAMKVSMEFPLTPEINKVPGYEKMMENMFGPGGKIDVYLAAADDHTVVAAYTFKESLLKGLNVVAGTQPRLSADEGVAKTAAALPAGAQCVFYVSPKGTVDFVNRLIPVFAPEQKPAFKLPEFPATPPIGYAVKTVPGGVRGYMVVPAEVVQAIGGFVAEVKKMVEIRGGGGEVQAIEVEPAVEE